MKVSVPKLVGQLKLVAYKYGEKLMINGLIYTVDVFTKRYNSKKKYSDLSKMVLNDLNKLREITIHKTSKKYYKIGIGVVYYNNPQDLLDRLELLGSSIDRIG